MLPGATTYPGPDTLPGDPEAPNTRDIVLDIQVYQVDLAPPSPAQVLMPSGQTVDASLSVLMPSGTEVAVEATQVLMPG